MSDAVLSHEEVDTLLQGVSESPAAAPAENTQSNVRPYDVAAAARVDPARMPALELVNERFARLLRAGFFNFIRRSAMVTIEPAQAVKYGEYIGALSAPANINILQVEPLHGNALVIFYPKLVFFVVDTMFGGGRRGQATLEGRDFTPTEHRIIERMLAVVFESYEKSWEPVHPLKFERVHSETNPRFAAIAAPHELVVVTKVKIEVGDAEGAFDICIPFSTLEPIQPAMSGGVGANRKELDATALKRLKHQVQLAPVEMTAELTHAATTLRRVLNMKVGDVVPIEVPDTIVVHVDGVPLMKCRYGVSNGRYALKLDKWVSPGPGDMPRGGDHA